MTTRLLKTGALLLLPLVVGVSAACSSSQQDPAAGPLPPEDGIVLVIRNDLSQTFDCNLEVSGRPTRMLGTVRSNSTENFDIRTQQIAAGGFRVLCRRQSETAARSDLVRVRSRARITFTTSTGKVRIETFN